MTGRQTIRVDCYAGYRGEEAPRRFSVGDRQVEVVSVAEAWLEPGERCFRVEGDDGRIYLLRHRPADDLWQLGG